MKGLSLNEKQNIARALGHAVFRAGLVAFWGSAIAAIVLDRPWYITAVSVTLSATVVMTGVIAVLWSCKKAPQDQ